MSMKSIIQSDMSKCYLRGAIDNLHVHHVIHGTANRKKSDKYGLVIRVCAYHHDIIHNHDSALDLALKKTAQREFEKRYGHFEFMEVFGKNYL